jgi:hypothetical protein
VICHLLIDTSHTPPKSQAAFSDYIRGLRAVVARVWFVPRASKLLASAALLTGEIGT